MEISKKERIYRIIMLIVMVAFITFIITILFMYDSFSKAGNIKYVMLPGSSATSDLELAIQKVRSVLDQTYINADNIDENKVIEGAVRGYVEGLEDEYTSYMSATEWTDYKESVIGNYQGIGVYLSALKDTNEIVVLSTIPESPAEKAGIKSGDIINKVNGIEYNGDTMDEATKQMKEQLGKSVQLEIKRGKEVLNVDINTEVVRVSPITIEVLENNIGYMRMLTFDEGLAEDFISKYNQLISEGATSIILDVRFNGGGYIDSVIGILEKILPKDSTLMITNSKSHGEVVKKSNGVPIVESDIPIVILQNGYSASSTEILIGALKDHKRAITVGTKSYGKGVLQNVYMIDGAALKVTTDEFFTPNRNEINKVGIEPDYLVEVKEEYASTLNIPREEDAQLNKAIELLSE